MVYSIMGLAETGPLNDGFKMVNTEKLWDMVGFSFYTFEGIGTVLPILKESQNPSHFRKLLSLAFISLSIYFCVFAFIAYMYFGTQKEPYIINNFDSSNTFIKFVKLMYCVNLVFSYPLSVYPTNVTLETYTLMRVKNEKVKYWLANLSRVFVCFLACFLSIVFHEIIDEFLGLTGAVLGVPIILTIPTLCHYILCAKTKFEKYADLTIIVISLMIAIFCSYKNFVTFLSEFKN